MSRCSYSWEYQGKIRPTCGCTTCRDIYIDKIESRIRELEVQVAAQKALLDECERIMTGVAYYSPEAEQMMDNTLFKLRGKND